ncbi:peroxisomal acyl-coenzyme A oxidase 3-like isoform X1 [Anthonomus grandis grandis]|uniref:peroxisomal acyl-coenzyme A oxidase 3-like isoform X1 n=1 Tax=Anthonomus grandis grandis TaxID=2921223 RepID=UPI0021658378|nr:peroxisomal acyl-coenzyme A oxidase 3-like isoform X1 [Anthonomus grandis grandis]
MAKFNVLQDFKRGPLDLYRQQASFCWKKLKVFLDTEEVVNYQNDLYTELLSHLDYLSSDPIHSLSFDEERRLACRQNFIYKSIELLSIPYLIQNLKFPAAATRIMMQLSPSSTIKFSVTDSLFTNVIRTLGTERHEHFLTEAEEGQIIGCYGLTEVAHGSNVKGMQTTATYNKENRSFVVNSTSFEAAKCWVGGLGQMATHAIVYAQLYTENTHQGLHCFVVPVRDPKTLLPYPGVTVGDMGEKIGLNGIDNGFVMFNNYEIPKENLLNKLGDVTDNGQYVTPFRDPNKRHGAALGALSVGRVTITALCEAYGVKGLTIAIRYSAVRKQFGPDNSPEVPLLEYQTHQYRLLPYLAAAYVLRIFSSKLFEDQYQFAIDSALGNNKEKLPELGTELHAVSSASKPIAGWTMRDAIQECRECCGGHGYLKAARLGDIRNDHDANLTYEGENHVLIQQTANWLIKLWPLVLKGQRIATPLRSVDFLTDGLKILGGVTWKAGNVEEVCQPEIIMSIYQWLVCYLLKSTHDKLENLLAKKDVFWAKNDNQVFHAKNLSIAFIQHFMLQTMLETIQVAPSPEIKAVLTKLFALYGLFSLETYHMTSLYQGEMARGSTPATLIRDAILRLCSELKGEAVALVDVLAPPDFVLNSPLGASDGEVYKRLQSAIFGSPYAMRRPDWWQDITNWKVNVLKGKL